MVIREFSEAETETPGGGWPKLVLAPLDVTLQAILDPSSPAPLRRGRAAFAQATPVSESILRIMGRCSGIPLHDAHIGVF